MKTALPLALLALVILAAAGSPRGAWALLPASDPDSPPVSAFHFPLSSFSLCGPMAAVCDPYADKCPACKDCSACHWCSQKGGKCSTCLEAR